MLYSEPLFPVPFGFFFSVQANKGFRFFRDLDFQAGLVVFHGDLAVFRHDRAFGRFDGIHTLRCDHDILVADGTLFLADSQDILEEVLADRAKHRMALGTMPGPGIVVPPFFILE